MQWKIQKHQRWSRRNIELRIAKPRKKKNQKVFLPVLPVDVWNLHLHGNDRSLRLHINSCTANQELMLLENHWTVVSRAEEWKTCKRIKADQNWPRLGAGQRGSDAFVSIDSQKNLKSEFLYWKVLFIPENRRKNVFLCLLVMACGLPGSVGSGDTWCINNPSPGRPLLVWSVVLCDVARA